jgi:hypothetical protein
MKLRIALLLAVLVAGVASSYALAKGKPGSSTTSTGTTTTSHGKKQTKLVVCHKAGKSGRWVKITVATKAAEKAHLKRGDVLPDASGACPAPTPKSHTTTGSTSTGSTTTSPS